MKSKTVLEEQELAVIGQYLMEMALEISPIIKKGLGDRTSVLIKEDGTPVSKHDLEASKKLREFFETRPVPDILKYCPIVLEEGGQINKLAKTNSSEILLIDEIDGTLPLICKVPTATFAASYIVSGKPLVSLVLDAFLDETYLAYLSKGSYIYGNEKPLHVSSTPKLNKATIGITMWHLAKYPFGEIMSCFQDYKVLPINTGSTSHQGARVASGYFDGVVYLDDHGRDAAPTAGLVAEAGGKVSDIWGQEIVFGEKVDGMIASNGLIHTELTNCVKQALAKGRGNTFS